MPLRDMVFASGLKVYTTFSLRRYGSDMKEAQSKGYMKSVPEFSTVAYYMRNPDLTPILKGLITLSALPLKTVEEKAFGKFRSPIVRNGHPAIPKNIVPRFLTTPSALYAWF